MFLMISLLNTEEDKVTLLVGAKESPLVIQIIDLSANVALLSQFFNRPIRREKELIDE